MLLVDATINDVVCERMPLNCEAIVGVIVGVTDNDDDGTDESEDDVLLVALLIVLGKTMAVLSELEQEILDGLDADTDVEPDEELPDTEDGVEIEEGGNEDPELGGGGVGVIVSDVEPDVDPDD